MRRAIPLVAAGLLAAVATAAALAAGAPSASPGTSSATGYAALLPGGSQGGATATSTGPRERSASAGGLRPAGGGSVAAAEVRVGAAPDGATGVAEGAVTLGGISLLDGRVSISGIRMSARATAGPSGADAGLVEAAVEGLVVDGRAMAAGPGSRVDVPGIGALVVLESVSDGAGGLRANALRVEVTDPQAAAVIGQPFVLGHLDLSASPGVEAPPAATAPEPRDPAEPPRALPSRRQAAPDPAPGPLGAPPALGLPRRPAPEVALPADGGYVFPIVGQTSFVDDFGAPRAVTGSHEGNDIFAETGTPVVAIADGTLSRVGVNTLGGNRLWLTDDAGTEFYYAHLSAYAPATVSGARVRAGQVIGFVGNTGQAITTPPHLHLQIHPGGGDSVNPYPYLLAWQRGGDLALAFRQSTSSSSPAPAVGAVLVDGAPELDRPAAPDAAIAVPVG